MSRHLTLALGALLVSAACLGPIKVQQSLSPTFGDLTAIQTVSLTGESGEVLMQGTFTESTNSDGELLRVASMAGSAPGPTGTVEIEIDRANGLSEEEVTIRLRDLPYPVLFRLMADGKELAMFSSNQQGKVEMTLARRVTTAETGK